jgi:REP element-mobilizing transposase RayT
MTYARKTLVCLKDTPYYHLIARCVRRAWLWGVDEYAGRDYSHRKIWVLERLTQLSSIFAIDICAYAVMSNHYHLVVRVDAQRARGWSSQEVIDRWTRLFSAPPLVQRWLKGECGAAEGEVVEDMVAQWRQRLIDVSWYMRCLNEHLARRANAEDQCKGRFWEGRFKSQALLDEAGLLTAMAYVDLNPIRAGIAGKPEMSEFTSVQQRIRALRTGVEPDRDAPTESAASDVTVPLLGFSDERTSASVRIPFAFRDYVELVDWSGRAIRGDKRGAIDTRLPRLLDRLNIDAAAWPNAMHSGGNVFGRALGQLDRLRLHARSLGQSWIRGLQRAERLYGR